MRRRVVISIGPMRYELRIVAIVAVLLAAIASIPAQQSTGWSQNVSPLPSPTGFVNDYVGVMDQAAKQQLETKLRNFRDTTNPSVEIAVAVIKTTGDRDIFDYSLAVARGWKIGSKADDNPSALLFIAIDDRKYFTQVSKDLEDELPDGVVGSLQRQYLVPQFKQGNYSKGISETVDAYIRTIQAKQSGEPAPSGTSGSSENDGACIVGCCIAAFIFGLLMLILFLSRRQTPPGGGSSGGWRSGGFGDAAAASIPWIIDAIANSSSSGSSSSDWGGSSGGSDWGGFGGGGDFGGGGAGGDW